MPTGTGKTGTMQTVENCAKFGILKEIGVIAQRAKYPNVLCLKSQPKAKDNLEEMLNSANIIVATVFVK